MRIRAARSRCTLTKCTRVSAPSRLYRSTISIASKCCADRRATLYGKNATGGAVSFYSANPSLTVTNGYVTAGVGNYSDYSVRAAAGAPIIEGALGVRAAVMYEKRDGWVKSVVPGVEPLNGVDAFAGRLTVLSKPTDNLTATLKIATSKSGGTPYGAHALNNDRA